MFWSLFCCIFCLQLLLCLFLCFEKPPLLRSYAASCNFVPIGHEIPLAVKKRQDRFPKYRKKLRFIPFYLLKKDMNPLSSSPSSPFVIIIIIIIIINATGVSHSSSPLPVTVVGSYLGCLTVPKPLNIEKSRNLKYQGNIFPLANKNLWHISSFSVGLGLNPTKAFKQSFFPYLTCDLPGEFPKIINFKTGVTETSCCNSARWPSRPCDLNARVLKKMEVRIQQEFCLNDNE